MRRIPSLVAAVALIVLAGCGGGNADRREATASWELSAPVDPSTAVLPITVFVGSSSCDRFDGVEAVETTEAVTVTATISSLTGDRACTSDLWTERAEVTLEEPLGDRELLGCGRVPGYPDEPRDCLVPSVLMGPAP
jgi:hypothetical protein